MFLLVPVIVQMTLAVLVPGLALVPGYVPGQLHMPVLLLVPVPGPGPVPWSLPVHAPVPVSVPCHFPSTFVGALPCH